MIDKLNFIVVEYLYIISFTSLLRKIFKIKQRVHPIHVRVYNTCPFVPVHVRFSDYIRPISYVPGPTVFVSLIKQIT